MELGRRKESPRGLPSQVHDDRGDATGLFVLPRELLRGPQNASQQVRRRLNQVLFARFVVGEDSSTDAEPADVFSALLAPDLVTTDESHETVEACGRHRNRDWLGGIPEWLRDQRNTKEPRPAFAGPGLNNEHLVSPAGFDPARFSAGRTRATP